MLVVKNENRPSFSNQEKAYVALWTINVEDNLEQCLLFTDKEINNSKHIGGTCVKDLTYGKIYTFGKAYTNPSYIIRVLDLNKQDIVLMFSKTVIERAAVRAKKNIEDNPAKKWYVDKIFEELKRS